MSFQDLLRGIVTAAVLLLATSPARASLIASALPDARYTVHLYVATESPGFTGSVDGTGPGTYHVGCDGLTGGPFCTAAIVSAAPSPTILLHSNTALTNHGQSAEAEVSISYYYEVVCALCAPGTVVPLGLDGYVQFDYSIDPAATTIGDSASVDVWGYNPLTHQDGANLGLATASAGGFCEFTYLTGTTVCTNPAAHGFTLPLQARVNTAYPIIASAAAGVFQTLGAGTTSSASAILDPVISFAPGFDPTGFSIAVSPGIGNSTTATPEPGTFVLLSLSAVCLFVGRRRPGRRD